MAVRQQPPNTLTTESGRVDKHGPVRVRVQAQAQVWVWVRVRGLGLVVALAALVGKIVRVRAPKRTDAPHTAPPASTAVAAVVVAVAVVVVVGPAWRKGGKGLVATAITEKQTLGSKRCTR